jgi:hypothetical protein
MRERLADPSDSGSQSPGLRRRNGGRFVLRAAARRPIRAQSGSVVEVFRMLCRIGKGLRTPGRDSAADPRGFSYGSIMSEWLRTESRLSVRVADRDVGSAVAVEARIGSQLNSSRGRTLSLAGSAIASMRSWRAVKARTAAGLAPRAAEEQLAEQAEASDKRNGPGPAGPELMMLTSGPPNPLASIIAHVAYGTIVPGFISLAT